MRHFLYLVIICVLPDFVDSETVKQTRVVHKEGKVTLRLDTYK